jgi:hypothetical protein
MIGRVLLDTEVFYVTQGLLGGLTCTHKLGKVTRKASLSQRLYLTRVIDAMKLQGVEVVPGSAPVERALEWFASAVSDQGSMADMMMRNTDAEMMADIFMNPAPRVEPLPDD